MDTDNTNRDAEPSPASAGSVSVENRRDKMLWIVGKSCGYSDRWEFQGVFDSEEKAVAACVSDDMFVGPAKLNTPVSLETKEWPGAYYPAFREVAFGKRPDAK
jgi:hypothetical protein